MTSPKAALNSVKSKSMQKQPLILASASPRRLELLRMIGVEPQAIVPADVDESLRKGEAPSVYAQRLSREKARAVAEKHPGKVVLASDTVVMIGRRVLDKAHNDDDVRHCLKRLSGRRHQVLTAVTIIDAAGRENTFLEVTRVKFRRLLPIEMDAYVASGEGVGKAGGYAIQGLAAGFIPWISGSFHAVMGLPVARVYPLLLAAGVAGR